MKLGMKSPSEERKFISESNKILNVLFPIISSRPYGILTNDEVPSRANKETESPKLGVPSWVKIQKVQAGRRYRKSQAG